MTQDLFTSLKAKLAAAMVYTKVGKKLSGFLKSVGDSLQSKGIFNTWMLEEQDSIQAFAKSYADRYHDHIYQLSPQVCTGYFWPTNILEGEKQNVM